MASLQTLKNQFEEIHKIKEDLSISSSSYEEFIEESEDSSIELIIDGEEDITKNLNTTILSHFIMKMYKLKSLLNTNNTSKIDIEKFNIFKKDRKYLYNKN